MTERFAPDLLSNGVVPSVIAAHTAARQLATRAKVSHIPKTIELMATPVEIRSDKLGDFDIRPFNALRHTSSNDKADFWWWPVRMDNQHNVKVGVLGPSQTLCGFDLERSPEISLDEVRRTLQLPITMRGRCNGIALWWTAKSGNLEYTTAPRLPLTTSASGQQEGVDVQKRSRPEWKQ